MYPEWNYLVGVPGERAEDYEDQPKLLRALTHLPPPITGVRRIYINRFSPYHTQPGQFGITDLRPRKAYSFIYPGLSAEDVNDLAYYFDGEFDGQDQIPLYTRAVQEEVDNWLDQHGTTALFSMADGECLLVCDFRQDWREPLVCIDGLARKVYEACDQIRGRNYLLKLVSDHTGIGGEDSSVMLDSILAPLLDRQLMLEEDQRYLALAVPLGFEYVPPERVWPKFVGILDMIPRPDAAGQRQTRTLAN